MSEQITVQYVNAPKPGKTNGSVKTQDGRYLGVKPEMLSQFTQGGTYTVEVSSRQWQGKTFYNINSIVSGGGTPAPNGASQQAQNTAFARDDRSNRIERQHSQEMSLRYFTLRQMVAIDTKMLRDMTDWFQRDIGHVPKTSTKTQPVVESEPTPDDNDEPF